MKFNSSISELNQNEYKYDDRTLAHIYFELKFIVGESIQEQCSNIVFKRVNNAIYEYWKNNLSNVSYTELDYMLHKQYYIADVECCNLLLELHNIAYKTSVFKWEILSLMIDKVLRRDLEEVHIL